MDSALNIFLLELAAIFPVVNPPGSALVFLGMTGNATHEVRRLIAWRVARNAFFVLVGSLSLGALILRFYGISIPVLRVAGGFIVAVAGWKLLSEGSQKELEASVDGHRPARSSRPGLLSADAALDDRARDHRRRHQPRTRPGRAAFTIARWLSIEGRHEDRRSWRHANVVGYELVATGEDGTVARQRLDFRYRRAVFDLLPPVAHFQGSGPEPRETRYESDANLVNVSSLTCSFQFDRPIEGEAGRAGLRGSSRLGAAISG